MTARLAVWGAPIDHSKSPVLHSAAYRALGLDWEYGRKHVDAEHFIAELAQRDATWRGLSLTMPLKEAAFRSASSHDRHAQLTGAVNTLLFGDVLHGFNTDVGGIIDALAENGIRSLGTARILGAGATAASALVAVAELGAQHVDLRARRPERAEEIARLGGRLGVHITVSDFLTPASDVDVTIATLPTGTVLDADVAERFAAAGGVLLDAAYAPWPSALARVWNDAGAISGLAMLFNQAVRQVRVFVHGDPLIELPDERRVRDEMYAALMGD